MMSPEELEAMRKEDERATLEIVARKSGGEGSEDMVTKGKLRNEMRSMLQELMAMGLLGAKMRAVQPDLKLEIMPNDVKLEGSKTYLSWARRVSVLLGAKGV